MLSLRFQWNLASDLSQSLRSGSHPLITHWAHCFFWSRGLPLRVFVKAEGLRDEWVKPGSLPVGPRSHECDNETSQPSFFVPKIILAQSIKAYFGGSLRKQPSLCEASWAAVFAVWSRAPWLGVMWREWWRKSFFENHSLHDPQHVLGLGSPFFIDYVVNFRAQYTVIKSSL